MSSENPASSSGSAQAQAPASATVPGYVSVVAGNMVNVVPVSVLTDVTFGTQYMLPFPGQKGAPSFDGKNISGFLTNWEDLTIGWPENLKVKKVPLYCQTLIGKYVRALEAFKNVDDVMGWETFKVAMLEEFKEDDEEQQKYSEPYLQRAAQDMRGKKDASAADYRAFALDFSEKADGLLTRGIINEYKRVTLFLQA